MFFLVAKKHFCYYQIMQDFLWIYRIPAWWRAQTKTFADTFILFSILMFTSLYSEMLLSSFANSQTRTRRPFSCVTVIFRPFSDYRHIMICSGALVVNASTHRDESFVFGVVCSKADEKYVWCIFIFHAESLLNGIRIRWEKFKVPGDRLTFSQTFRGDSP